MIRKYLYITLFIISIVGLSLVQYQYFRIGLNLAGVQFDENIGKAAGDIKEGLKTRNELTYLVATAITGEAENFSLGLDSIKEASSYFLNDFLQATLVENGIKAKFTYDLQNRDTSRFLSSPEQFEASDDVLSYPIAVDGFLEDYSGESLTLNIRFKNVNQYFLSQLNGLTIPSLIFIVVIVLILIWVFRAFYLQKNLITQTNEFINNLTHELKTPVFSMGVASKILEDKIQGEPKEVLGVMRSQLDKMKTQIDKVLELAIIEGKKDVLKITEFDLHPILDRIGKEFGRLINLEGGDFSKELEEGPYFILGDTYHIDNAINSLLENARKYSTKEVNIELRAVKEKNQIKISISDQGIGISKEAQKRVFEKFYRVSNGDRHDVKGYGLGLHYVKRIVTLHKGKIEVKSEEGMGSVFTVSLPLLKQ